MSSEILSIIGASTGILAIAAIIYGFGVKFSRLETKVGLIWSIFVEDSLRNQVKTGMLEHHSPYQRSYQSMHLGELVPSAVVDKLRRKTFKTDDLLTTAIIKEMGLNVILEESRRLDISAHEFLALSVGTVRGMRGRDN